MGCSFFCSTVSEFFGWGVQSTDRSVRSKRGPRTRVALVENLATEWPILILILGWNAITSHQIGNRRDPSFESSFRPPFFSGIRFFWFPGPGFFAKLLPRKVTQPPQKKQENAPTPFPDFSAASLDLFPESPGHLAPCEPVGAHFFHLGFFDEFFRHLAGATVSRPG